MDDTRLYLTSAQTKCGPWHTAHRGQLCLCVTGERQSEEGRSLEHPGLWLHNTLLCVSSQVPLVQLFRNAKYSILKGAKWGFPGCFQHIKGYLWERVAVRSEVLNRVLSTPFPPPSPPHHPDHSKRKLITTVTRGPLRLGTVSCT